MTYLLLSLLAAFVIARWFARDVPNMSVAVLLLVGVVLAWRLNPRQALPVDTRDVPRIGAQEARRLVERGEAVLVDVRASSTYNLGHLRGAVNVTSPEIEANPDRFPPDRIIITYCS